MAGAGSHFNGAIDVGLDIRPNPAYAVDLLETLNEKVSMNRPLEFDYLADLTYEPLPEVLVEEKIPISGFTMLLVETPRRVAPRNGGWRSCGRAFAGGRMWITSPDPAF